MNRYMNTKNITIGLAAVAVSIATAQSARAVNFVLNGGFVPVAGSPPANDIRYGVVIPNWTSSGYNFLYKDGLNATGGNTLRLYSPGQVVNSADGSGWFIGADGGIYQGTISQQLRGLTVGTRYDVSFYQAAGQQQNYGGDTNNVWAVNLGGTFTYTGLLSAYYAPNTNPFNGGVTQYSTPMFHASRDPVSAWQKQTLTFTATSTNPLLSFLAQGSPSGVPPFSLISGVAVEPSPISTTSVPEPFTMIGTLIGGTVALRLRKKLKSESDD
jgi:hypothetical protein